MARYRRLARARTWSPIWSRLATRSAPPRLWPSCVQGSSPLWWRAYRSRQLPLQWANEEEAVPLLQWQRPPWIPSWRKVCKKSGVVTFVDQSFCYLQLFLTWYEIGITLLGGIGLPFELTVCPSLPGTTLNRSGEGLPISDRTTTARTSVDHPLRSTTTLSTISGSAVLNTIDTMPVIKAPTFIQQITALHLVLAHLLTRAPWTLVHHLITAGMCAKRRILPAWQYFRPTDG